MDQNKVFFVGGSLFQMTSECPSSSRRGVTSPGQVGVLERWRNG